MQILPSSLRPVYIGLSITIVSKRPQDMQIFVEHLKIYGLGSPPKFGMPVVNG